MTLNQLHYVITVADAGSMNRAAERLYITQPSLTSAIKELEKELGITIFYRNGRGVTLTNDGAEFLLYAREIYGQYEAVMQKYSDDGGMKQKFGISMQHYSFAVKAFVNLVNKHDLAEYDFAIRETKTKEVISDVAAMKSEIGIIYQSDFNRNAINKILRQNSLQFHELVDCDAFVYLWKGHPLANRVSVGFKDLADYPNLTFEQGDDSTFYYAEEIFSETNYSRTIRVNDRATMLNLMRGVHGYTLCSGIICEDFNGGDYLAVPFNDPETSGDKAMQIGYIQKKNSLLSKTAQLYIRELQSYLGIEPESAEDAGEESVDA